MSSIIEEIEEEYQRFIEFGEVLDRRTRQYLVAYLRQKLLGVRLQEPDLQNEYFHYFSEALEDLFEDEDLKKLARRQKVLGAQVLADTLSWFRKAYGEIAKQHPYEEEERELGSWGIRHMRQFIKSYPFLTQKVSSYYPKEEIDPSFHHQKFKSLIGTSEYEALSPETEAAIERVIRDLLGQWDARLQAKILNFQMRKLQEKKKEFKDKLEAKVQEYEKLTSLVKPFTEELSRYWDMSRALWEDSTLNLIEEYDALLQDEEELRKLAMILGQMREAEIETQEEHYERTVLYQEWVPDPNSRTEIVGVSTGADLNQVLPSEVALFGESTEWQFLKRFAEEQLQVNQYEDRRLVESNKVFKESYQKVKKKEKGPFIVCVDTSGSMEGEPERIAKVLCFAILKMAAEDQRQAFLINFSSGIHTIDLFHLVDSIDEVAAFLQKSFHGGTDISLALAEALKQLETHRYRDADVLVISDFIMYKISEDLQLGMEKQQHNHGTQFHSLIITDEPNEEVIAQFDNVWSYDPDRKGVVKEIYRNLDKLRKRHL